MEISDKNCIIKKTLEFDVINRISARPSEYSEELENIYPGITNKLVRKNFRVIQQIENLTVENCFHAIDEIHEDNIYYLLSENHIKIVETTSILVVLMQLSNKQKMLDSLSGVDHFNRILGDMNKNLRYRTKHVSGHLLWSSFVRVHIKSYPQYKDQEGNS